jgi:Sulfotransferase family
VLFDGFETDYLRSRGKSRWADKNSRYALSLDHLLELFPDCQVVHVIRGGHGVVVSQRELLEFLGEEWDPAVLEHGMQRHDISTHYGAFGSGRRQTAQEPARLPLAGGAHRREMDPLLCLLFHLRSGGTLRQLGYC